MNDLISRKAAIEAIKEDKIDLTNSNVVAVFKATGDFEKAETQVMTCDRHIKILKELPSERKHGKWVKEYWNGEHTRKCSACNITQTVTTYRGKVNFNYCPYCGADMREVQDD